VRETSRFGECAEKWLFPFVRMVDRITWVVLLAMMTMTMIDVLLRKFTNHSLLGTVELTEMMMVIVVFCSLAQCETKDGHIKIDLLYKRFSPRLRAIVDTVTQFTCFLLFCFMTCALYLQAMDIREWQEVTMDLRMPVYPFVFIACFGCALLALVLLFKTVAALNEAIES